MSEANGDWEGGTHVMGERTRTFSNYGWTQSVNKNLNIGTV